MAAHRTHEDWMGVALGLAKRGLGSTWPNPSVGCVIVKENRIIGRGHTQKGGRPHAEVEALAQAKTQASGATAYVTLEPCSHHGKSPPCTDALIKSGVKCVVVAQLDPDPRVDGLSALRSAGIDVITGVSTDKAVAINAGFTTRITQNRPHLTLKIATSLDGKIASQTGESRWITGAAARRCVHMLRASHDAIMVGRGTVEADDPMLDVRELGPLRSPVRIVLDRQLRTKKDARIVKTSADIPTWLVHAKGAQNDALKNCKLIEADNLQQTMKKLAGEGLTRIFCEGGATLSGSLLRENLVDQLIVFQAGKMIGVEGLSAIGALDLMALNKAPQFDLIKTTAIGPDTMSIWQRGV